MTRIFLYPKDLQILTGRSIRHCQMAYNQILDAFGKDKKKGLLVKDYAIYHGISEEDIAQKLKG
jgi:hypothetical protein